MADNKLATIEQMNQMALSASDIQEQVNIIQKVMKQVMKKDVHFGMIPGCGTKPTLLKAGSEKLLSTFRIGVDPVVEDLSTEDEVKYRVMARGIFYPTGNYLGSGVGVASSNEEKYKWKGSSCKEEFDAVPETRKRIKYAKKDGKAFPIHQVRTNVSDVANTILKMAKKRAQIDMTLTVLAASDIFTQDIEEMEISEEIPKGKPIVEQPRPKKVEPEEKSEQEQAEITPAAMFTIARENGIPQAKIKIMMKKVYKKESTADLTEKELKEIIEWIKGEASGK